MILTYTFTDNDKEHQYKYKVLREQIIAFLEDKYTPKEIRSFIEFLDKEQNVAVPEYLLNNDLHDIYDRLDAADFIARKIASFAGTPLFDEFKKYFENVARDAFDFEKQDDWDLDDESYDAFDECLTEDLEDKDLSDTEVDYKKEYIDKYGDTIVYADGQIECKILDVTYDPEFGYDVKIKNPLYVADMSDEFEEIWIGDPNFVEDPEDEEIELLPSVAVQHNAKVAAEEIAEEDKNNPDHAEVDDFLSDNW